MEEFHVVEHFVSINGEGKRAGQLALFIRFAGCNLNCKYCDTKWANEKDVAYELYTTDMLCKLIESSGVRNVTLTGGEPLLQRGMQELLKALRTKAGLRIEIETNGSVDIVSFMVGELASNKNEVLTDNVSFTLDYKLGVSGMEQQMYLSNYVNLRNQDTVKFVVGSRADLEKAKEIICKYHLIKKNCGIFLSPCFGAIKPKEMVDFLIENKLNDVNIQLQLHKYIWDPDKKGV